MDIGGGPAKRFDIVHLGHNWWRWRDMSTTLLPALERIRARVGEICLVGAWWDGTPPWARALNLEAAFWVDSGRLRRLQNRVGPPVPYTRVVQTGSEGRGNITTQRPVFRRLPLLTAKQSGLLFARP